MPSSAVPEPAPGVEAPRRAPQVHVHCRIRRQARPQGGSRTQIAARRVVRPAAGYLHYPRRQPDADCRPQGCAARTLSRAGTARAPTGRFPHAWSRASAHLARAPAGSAARERDGGGAQLSGAAAATPCESHRPFLRAAAPRGPSPQRSRQGRAAGKEGREEGRRAAPHGQGPGRARQGAGRQCE